jgi:aryl-phospho-beta-D-glucosidase BglC (GH1 family)
VLADPAVGKWSLTANPEWRGENSIAILERIVNLAARRGLLVMLNIHRLHANVWPTAHGLWHEDGFPAERLESAWIRLARRFCRSWNVVAADLFNEHVV